MRLVTSEAENDVRKRLRDNGFHLIFELDRPRSSTFQRLIFADLICVDAYWRTLKIGYYWDLHVRPEVCITKSSFDSATTVIYQSSKLISRPSCTIRKLKAFLRWLVTAKARFRPLGAFKTENSVASR